METFFIFAISFFIVAGIGSFVAAFSFLVSGEYQCVAYSAVACVVSALLTWVLVGLAPVHLTRPSEKDVIDGKAQAVQIQYISDDGEKQDTIILYKYIWNDEK